VCPARDPSAALILPKANAKAMNLHLMEISSQVSAGAHAVVILDRAGWHKTGGKLRLPDTISLLHLPAYSPELNPAENIWPYLRQNQLSNRIHANYKAIVDACCDAWNQLLNQAGLIASIATRSWAQRVTA
jgi:transposase